MTIAKARKILPLGVEIQCEQEPHTDCVCWSYIGEALPEHDNERILQESTPIAYLYPVQYIRTDPQRFQNRTDHYSEASAQAVAENYNANKFDPIVLWVDPANGKVYVLSGHSRLEGMKRRKEKYIPARFFVGSEAEAIQFARVEANRANTRESLIEDVKAYILMREGNLAQNIAPATPRAIKEAFRGKETTLEQLAYLNQQGKFIETLANDDIVSQFPQIQRFAKWVGALRKKYGIRLTNRHEADIFNFLYNGDAKNTRMSRENFEELIRERLELGKERLFPECSDGEPCKEIRDLKELPPNGHFYKQISEISKDLEIISDRVNNRNVRDATRILTEGERKALKELYTKLETKLARLKRDLGIVEKTQESGLFGTEEEKIEAYLNMHAVTYAVYATEGKKKYRYFSTARTATEARKEAKINWSKKTKITKIIKI